MSSTYELRVKGHLHDRWSEWFGGLTVRRLDDGTTVLSGPIADQAALYGLINRLRDLGLPLLSMKRAGPRSEEESDGACA